jgi:hypothetical protein
MTWGLELGMHPYLYLIGGPWAAPHYTDPITYLSPAVWVRWHW